MSKKPEKAGEEPAPGPEAGENITDLLEEVSNSESDDEVEWKVEETTIAASGRIEDEDIKLEREFDEELDRAYEITNADSDLQLKSSLQKLEILNSYSHGRYEDILPQIIDGRSFVIDGDSLLLFALKTNGLSMDSGGQTLHLIYIVEKFLLTFISRGLNFVVVFFEVWKRPWSANPEFSLARNALKLHFEHNQQKFSVLTMHSLWSEEFTRFLAVQRPGFIMISSTLPGCIKAVGEVADADSTRTWLQFIAISQAVYCEFLCLDVVDIDSINSGTSCLMATVFVHYNHFKSIHKRVLDTITSLEEVIPFSIVSQELSEFPEPCLRVSSVLIAASAVLKEDPNDQIVTVVKTMLLSLAFIEHLPLSMRCFKNLPKLPDQVEANFFKIQKRMADVLNNVPLNKAELSTIDFKNVGDMWQGLFLTAVIHSVRGAGTIECSELSKIISTRYEELISHVNKLQDAVKVQPYPLEHICEGACTGHKLEKPTPSVIPFKAKLIPSSCKLSEMFAGNLATDERLFSDDSDAEYVDPITYEDHHWRSTREFTDEYDRIPDDKPIKEENKRYAQNQRNTLARYHTIYGLSLEGRTSVKAIVTNSGKSQTQKKTVGKSKTQSKGKLSKKDQIILDNNKRIADDKQKKVKERLKSFFSNFTSLMLKGDSIAAIEKCDLELQRAKEFKDSSIEILFHKGKACYRLWADECMAKRKSSKTFSGATELFLVVREILKISEEAELPLNSKQNELLALWLYNLGFKELAGIRGLPKPSKDSTGEYSVEMNHVDFQLTHLGAELLRETGGKQDHRADGFIPDPWQVELFDIIDKNQSAVVVAPTSSGKTYASYYCMESVIRNNDDDVVVYVCPTKALVNQVYATIYARFKKNLPPGKTLQGIFTMDYRQNVRNCQILTTVPECLEMMLISPKCQTWVKKIKYVIFDEVHCLLGQSGGLAWENSILLSRCPYLALSATIENPENFRAWLQEVEDFKKLQTAKFKLNDRSPESYKVSLVVHSERHNHLLKNVMMNDGSIQHVHPYSFLNLCNGGDYTGIPKTISLSPDEALELYKAMLKVLPAENIVHLNPFKYFEKLCPSGYLSMQAVRKFSIDLREFLENESLDKQMEVLSTLKTVEYSELETGEEYVLRGIPKILDVLKEKKMLPALVFTYNRRLVQALPLRVLRYLRDIDDFTEDDATDIDSESESESKKDSGNKNSRRFRGKRYTKKLGLLRGPSMLKSNGSLRGEGFTDEKMIDFIEYRLKKKYKAQDNFPSMLRRGLGMHYEALSARERTAVEMLFRLKILNLVAATGTLALGIHMPCKTVVVAGDNPFLNVLEFNQMSGRAGRRGFDKEGNVVFFGLNHRKLETLMTGGLPQMVGNFPLNISLILRVFLLVSGVTENGTASQEESNVALARAFTLLQNGLLYQSQKNLKERMKFFFFFVVQFLLKQNLMNSSGQLNQDALLLTHLHRQEPGNFAFYYLLKSGVLDSMCVLEKDGTISEKSLMDLVIVLSFLFARLPLSKHIILSQRVNSVVVLPRMPDVVNKALQQYNRLVLSVFSHFFKCVSADIEEKQGADKYLPLSELNTQPKDENLLSKEEIENSKVCLSLQELGIKNNVCSAFAGLSGITDGDIFPLSGKLLHVRNDMSVNVVPTLNLDFTCNAYAFDFYRHGMIDALVRENGLRSGQDFELLKNFINTLKTIYESLGEMFPPGDKFAMAMGQIFHNFESNFNKAYDIQQR